MPATLLRNKIEVITFSILIDGQAVSREYQVISIQVEYEINRIPFAKIKLADGGVAEQDEFKAGNSDDFVPGKNITIKAGYQSQEKDIFKGVIVRHSIKINGGGSELHIECRHQAFKTTIGRKNRVFLKNTDSDAITKILNEYSLTVQVSATQHLHEQLIQHYATDWDFVLMRADFNGFLVMPQLEKINIAPPPLSASPKYEIQYGLTMRKLEIGVDARNQYKKVTAYSWDYTSQELIKAQGDPESTQLAGNFSPNKLADVGAPADYVLQTSAQLPDKVLNAWSSAKLVRSKLAFLQGTVSFLGTDDIYPGDTLQLSGLSKRFNGKVFVRAVSHTLAEGDWNTEVMLGLGESWFAENQPNIEAPATAGNTPPFKGLTTGLVTKIDADPLGQFRVQVKIPTLQADQDSLWARMSSFYASNEAGAVFYPEVGDEVLLGFLNEDPQNPVILGKLYSSKRKPPFSDLGAGADIDADNKTKGFVSRSKLMIKFEEEKKIISIVTPANNKIVLDDDQKNILITDQHGNKLTLSQDGISMESAKDVSIKAKGAIKLESTQDTIIKATGNLKGEGMEVGFKGSTKFAAEGAMAELKGSGQTTIKGGIVMIN
ncbi:MAG: VgrG-related protein [Microscillaceae bacterium]